MNDPWQLRHTHCFHVAILQEQFSASEYALESGSCEIFQFLKLAKKNFFNSTDQTQYNCKLEPALCATNIYFF